MARGVNKAIIVGNLGRDPEVRYAANGNPIANVAVATTDSWRDKQSGERQEKTEWHRVVIFNQGLMTVCENYLKKGSKVYIEGQLETRSWDQDGQKKYTTEVVLRPYRGELTMLDSRNSGGASYGGGDNFASNQQPAPSGQNNTQVDELEDEIPF